MTTEDVPADPFARFESLFAEARPTLDPPEAVALATVGPDGRPSARMVLLRGFDRRGFVFYTNLKSRKARELDARPFAALCFHWPALERQVRVEGPVEHVPDEEADAYFATRPRGSQVGAWASRQSEVLESREALEARVAELERRFAGRPVPRPPFWSGFRVIPDRFEFWTGRPSRLHERERYLLEDRRWRVDRLYP